LQAEAGDDEFDEEEHDNDNEGNNFAMKKVTFLLTQFPTNNN